MKQHTLPYALVACLMLAMNAQAGTLTSSDLVAWWEMNDTSDSAGSRNLTLEDGATISGGSLNLDTDPSNNRAVTSAFNPTSSFSIFLDFQADSIPSGISDPQYVLLSNIGNDSIRTFSQFSTSAGYMIFLRPNQIQTFQKTGNSFSGAQATALSLSNPTGRHQVVVNWEYDLGLNQFRSVLFLDGSAVSATSGYGPMDFTTGTATTNLLLGTNVDEAFQPPRTLDGSIFESAIFNRTLTNTEIDDLARNGVVLESSEVPEPAGFILLSFGLAGLMVSKRYRVNRSY